MDSIKNKLDSSRIIVIVSVVYVIIITAISMYLYMKFNEKERFDRRFTNRLEEHGNEEDSMYISTNGFHNPNNGGDNNILKGDIPYVEDTTVLRHTVSLVNSHVKTAFNCCAVNTYRNSWVSLEALKYCLDIGMRCLDFEIYSVNSEPVVGLNSREKNIDMKESFNKLPLKDVIGEIKRFTGDKYLNDNVTKTPLILHFRIKTKQPEALKKFAQQVKLLDYIHSESYYDIITKVPPNNTDCFIYKPLTHLDNKTIIIANFSSIKPSNKEGSTTKEIGRGTEFYSDFITKTKIENAVNLISPSVFCDYTTNRTVELAENNEVEPSKLTLSAPFSDFEGSCVPFNPKEVARAGVQLIGICAQKNLQKNPNKMVNDYFQLFAMKDGGYCSYIAKNADSRNLYYTVENTVDLVD